MDNPNFKALLHKLIDTMRDFLVPEHMVILRSKHGLDYYTFCTSALYLSSDQLNNNFSVVCLITAWFEAVPVVQE